MNNRLKKVIWYVAGCLFLLLVTCFAPASTNEMNGLYIDFLLLTIGLALGLLLKEELGKRPWLFFLIPFLQVLVLFFLLAV